VLSPEQAPALTVRDHWDADVAIVTVDGEIDVATVGVLTQHLTQLAAKHPQRMVIDLAGVDFIDSTGLGGFVRIRKALPPDCPVVLRSPQRPVRRVFKITGLDSVFGFE
jgi:anti-sigma B factor antagonist